jgi:hypothetical protein
MAGCSRRRAHPEITLRASPDLAGWSARTEQLAKALHDGFTRQELEVLRAAAPLIERLGETI